MSCEPCAFVGPSHECTASVAPRIRVLGRDTSAWFHQDPGPGFHQDPSPGFQATQAWNP
ncbi:hypothetical protein SLEP1_g34035 [Rubroshorea leprosula]|uniref:Uncharacterized protein n=1 Tax=Rubroshorea leprosula TaxID=152421 RepID=A0AAV5KIT1_9ROSI|nr:hypothetical protein SLEP1_g34035 [Rubroshorea leprosula]